MSYSHTTRTAVLLSALMTVLPVAPSIAAEGPGDHANRPERVHPRHAPRHHDLGRRHIRKTVDERAAPPVNRDFAPLAQSRTVDPWSQDPDTIRYGYVDNYCPMHFDNPHRATPDGFWYTELGQKLPCF